MASQQTRQSYDEDMNMYRAISECEIMNVNGRIAIH